MKLVSKHTVNSLSTKTFLESLQTTRSGRKSVEVAVDGKLCDSPGRSAVIVSRGT